MTELAAGSAALFCPIEVMRLEVRYRLIAVGHKNSNLAAFVGASLG
jgi:hypothetical protein